MVIFLFPMSLKKHPPLFRDHKSSEIYRAPRHNADICVGDACLHLAFLAIYILRITIDFNKACNLLFSMRRKIATKLQIMTFQLLQHALMHLYPHSFASDETYYGLPRTVRCSIWKRKISQRGHLRNVEISTPRRKHTWKEIPVLFTFMPMLAQWNVFLSLFSRCILTFKFYNENSGSRYAFHVDSLYQTNNIC